VYPFWLKTRKTSSKVGFFFLEQVGHLTLWLRKLLKLTDMECPIGQRASSFSKHPTYSFDKRM
jgi:hypothetical protein